MTNKAFFQATYARETFQNITIFLENSESEDLATYYAIENRVFIIGKIQLNYHVLLCFKHGLSDSFSLALREYSYASIV